ncbi:MAG: hypothetical protein ACXVH3_14350 [Solirubrobacteraceae bacterium]
MTAANDRREVEEEPTWSHTACSQCGAPLPHDSAFYDTDGTGPYCGSGCLELARRGVHVAYPH